MRVFTLATDEGFILANLKQKPCAAINLVFGNHEVSDLLNSIHASIQEDIQDMCAYEHAIGGNLQVGCGFKYLHNAWHSICDDDAALKLLYTLLKSVEPEFKEMFLCKNQFLVAVGGGWQDVDSMSSQFQYVAEVALQAYSARWGVVMFHSIEKAGICNVSALTEYLIAMGNLRENRTILSTQSMECLKAFVSVAADIDSALVKIKGNTPDNCDILAQAVIEKRLASELLEAAPLA